jgi:hypothetical protein
MFRKGTWEALPFIVGVLVLSAIVGWAAWNTFGFLTADAPIAVKIKSP